MKCSKSNWAREQI